MGSHYILSCDIGQMTDYTALATIQQPEGSEQLNLVDLVRLEQRTPYPDQVRVIASRVAGLKSLAKQDKGSVTLAMDVTGCGRGVYDLMVLVGLEPYAVTITGGHDANFDGRELHVPKKDLVTAAQVAMQQKKLKVPTSLKTAHELVKELQNFRYKITLNGSFTAEAWREGVHDDLVLAVSIGCWMATRPKPGVAVLGQSGGSGSSYYPEGASALMEKLQQLQNQRKG